MATSASIRHAFDELGLESLAVTSSYVSDLSDLLRTLLEDAGFDVVDISALGSKHGHNDLIFISCTNYRTLEIIEHLEADLGKPVVTSNQATVRDTLRTVGISDADIGLGTLFEQ